MDLFRDLRRIFSKLDGWIRNFKTNQDLFENIPPEIMIDIFSRLPVPSVLGCKCVCKSWMNLLESLAFAKSHVSKSVPVPGLGFDEDLPLTFFSFHSNTYTILELVDTQNTRHPFKVVFKFKFPHYPNLAIHSSASGLLLMLYEDRCWENIGTIDRRNLSICNPITREYIKLPLSLISHPMINPSSYIYIGFGVSKCGKYKVVRLYLERYDNHLADPNVTNAGKWEVYTLGTGSWRRVAASGPRWFLLCSLCVFLNGNLHWLVQGVRDVPGSISVFDLENEHFSTLSIPLCSHSLRELCTLRGSLCLCSNSKDGHNVEIWLMDKYGDDKSWRKLEFVIERNLPRFSYVSLVPQRISKDGDIIFTGIYTARYRLYCYSSKTRTIREVDLPKSLANIGLGRNINYTPTLLPLQTFTMENVTKF